MFRLIALSILMMGWVHAGSAEESVDQCARPEVVTLGSEAEAEPKKKQKKPKKSEKKHSEAAKKSPEMNDQSLRVYAKLESSVLESSVPEKDGGLPPKSANSAQVKLESSLNQDEGLPPKR